jgi:leader peptidase (prepilin peptidase)/N-methyltransferase
VSFAPDFLPELTAPQVEAMEPLWLAIFASPWFRGLAFVWGTLWGSFANVLIHRLPLGQSPVTPRSRCASCERVIAWYDNVPLLSFLWLRGRCRHCKASFSLRYLVVEIAGGLLSFVLFFRHLLTPILRGSAVDMLDVVAWQLEFAFALALIVVTYVDLDYWYIPPRVVLPLGLVGLLAAVIQPDLLGIGGLEALISALVGCFAVVSLRAFYLWWRKIEAIGLGDAYLLFMVGAFLGAHGLFFTIGAGAIQALLVAVPMRILGVKLANREIHEVHGDAPELGPPQEEATMMGTMVPFGPFLALAALEALFFPELLATLAKYLRGEF